jgi:hypothetical protein
VTFRPRIRTIKPEMWADEKIGRLSREARLLFVGLITMADDEGRLRAMPAAVLGHVFPYDDDAPKKLTGWLGELDASGLIDVYENDGVRYVYLPGFVKHQVINKKKESTLPVPPRSAADPVTGVLPDSYGTATGHVPSSNGSVHV